MSSLIAIDCLRSMPFGPHFLSGIHASNSFLVGQSLRTFQAEILSTGTFIITSPIDGTAAAPAKSILFRDGAIAYQFRQQMPYWVIADDLRFGYPLSHLYLENSGLVYSLTEPKDVAPTRPSSTIRESCVSAAHEVHRPGRPKRPILVIGHRNFAHHLWNELGGLAAWLEKASPDQIVSLDIRATHQPLGPLQTIFPSLQLSSITPSIGKDWGSEPGRIATRIGSVQVSSALRQTVVRTLRSFVDPDFITQLEGLRHHHPVLWVTVRPPGTARICLNESAFLQSLLASLLDEHKQCAVIMDGFSLPVDFSDAAASYSAAEAEFKSRIRSAAQAIDDIHRRLSETIPDLARRLLSVSGLSLANAITAAQYADYYICPAGSVQHKIAWLQNKPGFIHSCRAGIVPASQRWYAAQVEDGIVPDVISAENVEDVPPPGKSVVNRNFNYIIRDIPAAIAEVSRHIRQINACQPNSSQE